MARARAHVAVTKRYICNIAFIDMSQSADTRRDLCYDLNTYLRDTFLA